MKTLVDILHSGGHSLVVRTQDGSISCFDSRGVSDLYHILSSRPETLEGADVADKVVGKGAAALMALGKIARLHTDVISRPALELLESSGIPASFDILVENIINRSHTGICPVETLCLECVTPEECLPKIENFLNSIKLNNQKNLIRNQTI